MPIDPGPRFVHEPAWRRPSLGVVLLAAISVVLLTLAPAAYAAGTFAPQHYRCDGDPLTATLISGPMDDPTIPDPSFASVPVGGSVLLQWRDLSLQLPRTNNAGPASFSDGKWWWSLEDPAYPRFLRRRGFGDPVTIACDAIG